MKKVMFAGAILCAAVLLVSCGSTGNVKGKDGKYSATKVGYGGDVTVETTISGGKISAIELKDCRESKVVIERAFPLLQKRIIDANTADVDTVSGATFSSFAVKAAVADAMAQAGMKAPQIGFADKKEYKARTLSDVNCDILVVGAGTSGEAAAITAKEVNPSLNVILIEKLDILSGNGKYNLNFYDLYNSQAQKAKGNVDSKEQFIADFKNAGNSPERLQAWADGEEVMDAWLRSFGVSLDHNYGKRNHMATVDDYAGPEIQGKMEKYLYDVGVEVRTGTKGIDIIMENGAAKGVKVLTSHNESYNIYAKKTIISTGGFGWNQEILAKYAPKHVGYATSNQMGATGDFVSVFEKNGFGLEQMGKIRMIPLIIMPSRDLTNSGNGTILVNEAGKRFVNERSSELALAEPIRAQKASWMLVDSQKPKDHANVRKQVKEGRFAVAATLDEAAKIIGCDAATLKETVAAYNSHAAAKTADEFGHTPERAILSEGPYYLSKAESAVHMTKGGVSCNEKSQVLYENGNVVPNLYASGEVTWQSGGYSQATVFGRIAGENAARELTK